MGNTAKAVVSASKSVYNNVIKPAVTTVYNNFIKPVGQAAYTKIIKPIGKAGDKLIKFTVDTFTTTCGYIAEGIHWVDKNVTFGVLGGIGKNTFGRIYQFGNWLYSLCFPPKTLKDIYLNDIDDLVLVKLQILGVWLGDTFWSRLSKIFSPIAAFANGMLIKHWWIVGTGRAKGCGNNHPSIYFHFGFGQEKTYKGAIRYSRFQTHSKAVQRGRCYSAGNFHDDVCRVKSKNVKTSVKNAIYFAQKFDARYDLAQNNCQTFAQELYDYL